MAGFLSCEVRPVYFSAKALTVVCDSDPKPVTKGPNEETPIILSTRGRVARLTLLYRSSPRHKIGFDIIGALVEYSYIACDLIESDKR
jgi:hypothetical protein